MRPLSPVDCVSPAIARTRLVLFSPFRFGRTWKLGATGYFAFGSTVFLPFPLFYLMLLTNNHSAVGRALVLGGVALGTLLWFALFYVFTRLQLVFFDLVVHRGDLVAPAWRKYGVQTWPWLWLKVVVGCVLTALLAAPLLAYFRHAISSFSTLGPKQPPPPDFIAHFILFEFFAFALFGTLFLLGSLFSDFILPSIALENASLSESFRRFWSLVRIEPLQCLGFVAFKAVLAIVGYVAQTVVLYIVLFIFAIAALILGLIGYVILHALHASVTVMIAIACLIAIPTYLFVIFYGLFVLLGTLVTFLQAYSLYFLAGRYPLLGDLLERSTPPAMPLYAYPPQPQWPAAPTYPPVPQQPEPTQWHTAVYPPATPASEPKAQEQTLTNPPDIDATE